MSKILGSISWPLAEWLLMAAATPLLLFPSRYSLGGLLLVCIAWIVRRRSPKAGIWRISTPADPAIALILLTAFIGVIVSVDQTLSLNRATVLLLGWLLYESTVVTITIIGLDRRFLALIGVIGLLLFAISLTMTDWQAGLLVPLPWLYDQLPQIKLNLPGSGVPHSGGLFNPRTVAGAAILVWPINAVLALKAKELPNTQRLLHALAALLLISLILLTQSPQAILAVGATCFIFLLAWLLTPADRVGALIRACILFMIAFIGGFITFEQRLSEYSLASLLNGRAGFGLVARLELWIRAIRMSRTAPLTGIGLNNYAPIMDSFYPGYLLGPEAHAHNLILQTITDQGILGLFGLLFLISITIWLAMKGNRKGEQIILIGVIATLIGWLVYGFFEVLSLGHKPGLLLWLLFALPAALITHQRVNVRFKLFWALSLLTVLLTAIISWQTGAWQLNLATITAQQALSEKATLKPSSEIALQQLDLAEQRFGPQPHLIRLRALLQVKDQQPKAAAHSFRQLVALELREPLWWWAPAPFLSGDLPQGIRGLVLIYQNWHIRFPDRIEPIALLAYTYADGMGGHEQAITFLEEKLKQNQVEPSVLRAILAILRSEG